MEILERPELLRSRKVDLGAITLAGIALGSPSSALPRASIREVSFAPIVHHSCVGQGGVVQYFGHGYEPLEMDRVIDSVLCASGVLHVYGDYSFTIQRARVTKFSLYGAALDCCVDVKQWPDVAAAFGVPDRILALTADGDMLAYDAFYTGGGKWVRWDVFRQRLSFVVIGGSDADVSAGVRGGISRTEVALA